MGTNVHDPQRAAGGRSSVLELREDDGAYLDDLDVAALFADALMNLTPWALWDRYTTKHGLAATRIRAYG
jgi:hypothetical protein